MNPSREELLFQLALTKPGAERAAWLDRECGDDTALRARLEALLAAHEKPEILLAAQAEGTDPTMKLDFADAPDEAVGQTLGRYKLLERVGANSWRQALMLKACKSSFVISRNRKSRRSVSRNAVACEN